MPDAKPKKPAPMPFSSYQKFVVGVLAFLQFTIILDFMILSPLGATLIPMLKITPAQFGMVVSAYAFSAGASGFLAGGFADKFDRKRLLLFFYTGFCLGTLLCGLAPDYDSLLIARIVTGIFGGVVGSVTFAITTDLFPFEMRGRVMGILQTAFAASQVLGIPLGLYLSNSFDWHAPFLLIVSISALVGVLIFFKLQPIDAHLKIRQERSPLRHLAHTITTPRYVQGFAATALLSTGGFMLMPFSSTFNVNNLGVSLDQLPMIYMVTGLFSIFMGPIVGRLSDRIGKLSVFLVGTSIVCATVSIYTRLDVVPVWVVMAISMVMFTGVSARMISSSALMSALPEPADRGSYMSVSSSIQQVSGGLAAALAGVIVVQAESGRLERFDFLGDVVVLASVISAVMIAFIARYIKGRMAAQAAAA